MMRSKVSAATYLEVKFGENEKTVHSTEELRSYIRENVVDYGIARQGTADSFTGKDETI